MLESVVFNNDVRTFKTGDEFWFRPGINVLVGANGCGKSTLIELVRSRFANRKTRENAWRSLGFSETDAAKHITIKLARFAHIIGYDFERDSGRGAPDLQYAKLELQLYEMKHSHGESARMTMDSMIMPLAKAVADRKERLALLLDEPDANLSPRSAYWLVRQLRKIAEYGHQVIVTAHNPIVITSCIPGENTPEQDVLSIEHKRWMPADEFLTLQSVE